MVVIQTDFEKIHIYSVYYGKKWYCEICNKFSRTLDTTKDFEKLNDAVKSAKRIIKRKFSGECSY